jgi:hypothetical protein
VTPFLTPGAAQSAPNAVAATLSPVSAAAAASPPRRRWFVVALGLLAAVTLLSGIIVIRIKDKDGKEQVIEVPAGSTVTLLDERGKKLAELPPPAPQAAPDKPLGTGKYVKGLVIDVMELKPTNDNFLTVTYRLRNPTNDPVSIRPTGVLFTPAMYYVEEGGKFKFTVMKDGKGNFLASDIGGTIKLGPGESREYWAKFGRPHEGIKHITLYFEHAEPIEDVPVPADLKRSGEEAKPAAGATKALGTAKYQKGLVIDVTELNPTSDKFLTVKYRIRNPTSNQVSISITGVLFTPAMYYVEEGGKFKFTVMKDERGNFLASDIGGTIKLEAGESKEYWAKFGRPHDGIKHITLYFEHAEPIEDVPLPGKDK